MAAPISFWLTLEPAKSVKLLRIIENSPNLVIFIIIHIQDFKNFINIYILDKALEHSFTLLKKCITATDIEIDSRYGN